MSRAFRKFLLKKLQDTDTSETEGEENENSEMPSLDPDESLVFTFIEARRLEEKNKKKKEKAINELRSRFVLDPTNTSQPPPKKVEIKHKPPVFKFPMPNDSVVNQQTKVVQKITIEPKYEGEEGINALKSLFDPSKQKNEAVVNTETRKIEIAKKSEWDILVDEDKKRNPFIDDEEPLHIEHQILQNEQKKPVYYFQKILEDDSDDDDGLKNIKIKKTNNQIINNPETNNDITPFQMKPILPVREYDKKSQSSPENKNDYDKYSPTETRELRREENPYNPIRNSNPLVFSYRTSLNKNDIFLKWNYDNSPILNISISSLINNNPEIEKSCDELIDNLSIPEPRQTKNRWNMWFNFISSHNGDIKMLYLLFQKKYSQKPILIQTLSQKMTLFNIKQKQAVFAADIKDMLLRYGFYKTANPRSELTDMEISISPFIPVLYFNGPVFFSILSQEFEIAARRSINMNHLGIAFVPHEPMIVEQPRRKAILSYSYYKINFIA